MMTLKFGSLAVLAATALMGLGAPSPYGDMMAPRGPRSERDIYIPTRKNPRHGVVVAAPNPTKRAKVKASRKANKKRRSP